jgi:hypothetical protein
MDYKHKTFGSLAVRTRYAYQVQFIESTYNEDYKIPELQTIVFTSARMALKVMSEIEKETNMSVIEFKEIVMHV